jgi:hypothetical protein
MSLRILVAFAVVFACSLTSSRAAQHKSPLDTLDLSEPRDALYHLVRSLACGEIETARAIYIGQDKEFLKVIDAFETSNASFRRLAEVAEAKFGSQAVRLLDADRYETRLLSWASFNIALHDRETDIQGNTATYRVELREGLVVVFKLHKVDELWRVAEVPRSTQVIDQTLDGLKMAGDYYHKGAEAIKNGEFAKAYELHRWYKFLLSGLKAEDAMGTGPIRSLWTWGPREGRPWNERNQSRD